MVLHVCGDYVQRLRIPELGLRGASKRRSKQAWNMMRPQRHGSWSAQDDLKVGRHTVRLKRSLGEGGFAFIHLVEVRLSPLVGALATHPDKTVDPSTPSCIFSSSLPTGLSLLDIRCVLERGAPTQHSTFTEHTGAYTQGYESTKVWMAQWIVCRHLYQPAAWNGIAEKVAHR